MPAGRPSKYNEEMQEKADQYLDEYEDLHHVIPSITGLAQYLGLARDTVIDWAKDLEKPEFSYTVRKVTQEQELKLLRGGLSGAYNASIAKLVLHNHGYTDKAETKDTSERSIDDYSEDELDAYIEERKDSA